MTRLEQMNRWLVQVKGNPDGEEWEISVVKSNNLHGQRSWGWFDEDKLLVSHNGGPCKWPLASGLGDKMVKLAGDLARELNSKEGNG